MVAEAPAGTKITCVEDWIVPGTISIFKYQHVIKQQTLDSGMITIETIHNGRLAVVNPENFAIAKQDPAPEIKTREWKTNFFETL